MLKRLHLRNFTVFEDTDFAFGPGLNVLVGTNGTGKSHVLKLGYSTEMARTNINKASDLVKTPINSFGSALAWSASLYKLLPNVFLSNQLSPLIRRGAAMRTVVKVFFGKTTATRLAFQIIREEESGNQSMTSLKAETGETPLPQPTENVSPVFIPAKEVLTMGWLLPMYALREVPIDQTYPDLLRLLPVLPLKSPEPAVAGILKRLHEIIGGKVEEEGGRYYLAAPDQPRMEMNMVAEGMRKFATLYKLLANGTLTPETTLFWDEPEANLNPALLKEMAAVLAELARAGFQIILATHSLFLLKELHILSQKEKTPVRYFGLSTEAGGATQVATADTLTDLPNLVALDVEIAQSDTFLDVLNQEDANV
ncbi:MAG: AAA family ATPase [Hymenobacter sp.]|nr:AAA family ATPase [Hymenobacter sp.]